MKRFHYYRRFVFSLAALLALLLFTNPGSGNLNILLLTVPFVLLFITFYELCKLLFLRLRWPSSLKLQKVTAAAIASISVVAIMLQSLGQLTIRDFLLLSSLAVLFVWYLSQSTSS